MEANPENARFLPRPQRRIVVKDPASEFESEDTATSVQQLFGFLWEYPEVFDTFSNNFLVQYCQEQMQVDEFKVDQVLDLEVHRLFTDVTAEVMNYRVVLIQERFIKQIIDQAQSLDEVINNPLLSKFFRQLTGTNEARRCLHYLFRVKCERIDTSFFTVKNL